MRKRLRSATVLLITGSVLFALSLVLMLVLQLAGVGGGFDVLLSATGIGLLLLVLGGLMYAAGLSHKKTHRFLSGQRGRTMQTHGREDRSELERKTSGRI